MEKKPITKEGYGALQKELQNLIKEKRPRIIEDIAEARAHGDLKENAEYHAAKERQGWIESRIQQLNYLLASAEVVDIAAIHSDHVLFGATVTYRDIESGKESSWKLVGEEEADYKSGKISIQSPIGRAVLGKVEGDEVTIRVPKGIIEVEITSVRYI